MRLLAGLPTVLIDVCVMAVTLPVMIRMVLNRPPLFHYKSLRTVIILGAFTELRKATLSFVISVRLYA